MDDMELTRLASVAAFLKPYDDTVDMFLDSQGDVTTFDPLHDDGDAFRLMVKCAVTDLTMALGELVLVEGWPQDIYAATRRAIVRAAAEIGKKIDAPLVRAD